MITSRLKSLVGRYDDMHLKLKAHKHVLQDTNGKTIGEILAMTYEKGVLRLHGKLLVKRAWLFCGQSKYRLMTTPDGLFSTELPLQVSHITHLVPLKIGFETEEPCPSDPSLPHSVRLRWADSALTLLRLRSAFFYSALLCLPTLISMLLWAHYDGRGRVKEIFKLEPARPITLISPALWQEEKARATFFDRAKDNHVTIILPVYNALDLLAETLRRIECHTDVPYKLLILEDCSTDPAVRPFLREWVASRPDRVHLVEQEKNRGFVHTVNVGFEHTLCTADTGPVVLLNTDAWVPAGWASRLIAPFATDENIASATPMSNNAEIFSAPRICQATRLPNGAVDQIDATALQLTPRQYVTVPTGVGFCMAISRRWLERVPQFDEVFSPGYGEEVNWCQQTRQQGARHVAIGNLFVEHTGGHSFGDASKQALIKEHNAIIEHRYPDYGRRVQTFIKNDPLADARFALAIAWTGAKAKKQAVPIYLAHSLGGGAEMVLQHMLKQHDADAQPAIVLRVTSRDDWRIELYHDADTLSAETPNFDTIQLLLKSLPNKHVIYSCGVGAKDPTLLPLQLLSLLGPNDTVDILFHDFLPLSPSYTLLDSDFVFRGTPRENNVDKAHQIQSTHMGSVSLQDWQNQWYKLAQRAKLKVFSADSARHVSTVWPDLEKQIQIVPHKLLHPVSQVTLPPNVPPVIAVLGNINSHKGLHVASRIARLRQKQCPQAQIILIGTHDPAVQMPKEVLVHGKYQVSDLTNIAKSYKITHWLIPSIWPETFCFTVHEALATGLPVFAFELGAQGEAIRHATNGYPLPYTTGVDLAQVFWEKFNSTHN